MFRGHRPRVLCSLKLQTKTTVFTVKAFRVESVGWRMAILEGQDATVAWTLHADTGLNLCSVDT